MHWALFTRSALFCHCFSIVCVLTGRNAGAGHPLEPRPDHAILPSSFDRCVQNGSPENNDDHGKVCIKDMHK
jgi:hypothetical protein